MDLKSVKYRRSKLVLTGFLIPGNFINFKGDDGVSAECAYSTLQCVPINMGTQ